VVVEVTLATRSEFAGTNDGAGRAILVTTVPVGVLAACVLRRPVMCVLTFGVAGYASCALASSVLRNESSTAALGVPVPAIASLVIVVVGIALQALWRWRGSMNAAASSRRA
jgi:hypothetical protein